MWEKNKKRFWNYDLKLTLAIKNSLLEKENNFHLTCDCDAMHERMNMKSAQIYAN